MTPIIPLGLGAGLLWLLLGSKKSQRGATEPSGVFRSPPVRAPSLDRYDVALRPLIAWLWDLVPGPVTSWPIHAERVAAAGDTLTAAAIAAMYRVWAPMAVQRSYGTVPGWMADLADRQLTLDGRADWVDSWARAYESTSDAIGRARIPADWAQQYAVARSAYSRIAAELHARAADLRKLSRRDDPTPPGPVPRPEPAPRPEPKPEDRPILPDPETMRREEALDLAIHLDRVGKGKEDRDLVAAFQANNGLTDDGKYGYSTAYAMLRFLFPPPNPFYWGKDWLTEQKAWRKLLVEGEKRGERPGDWTLRIKQFDEFVRVQNTKGAKLRPMPAPDLRVYKR